MQGQVVIVTGASEGIGHALVIELARRGAKVVAAARRRDKLEALVDQCRELDGEVFAVTVDVADEDSCRALIDACVEHFGALDVLVNNAGISMSARFDTMTSTEAFERLMRVNYLGTVYCTFHALPRLKARRGLVVGISSLQGKLGFPLSTGYAASKHAVQGFFDSLRIELADDEVDVLVVSPGPVDTEIHARKIGAGGELAHSNRDFSRKPQMSARECARRIASAIETRRREVVMTFRGKLAVWLRPFFPRFVDRQLARAVDAFYADD